MIWWSLTMPWLEAALPEISRQSSIQVLQSSRLLSFWSRQNQMDSQWISRGFRFGSSSTNLCTHISVQILLFFWLLQVLILKSLLKCTFSIWRTSVNGTVSSLSLWVEQFMCLIWNVCSDGLLTWNSRLERQTPLVCTLLAGVICLLSQPSNVLWSSQ